MMVKHGDEWTAHELILRGNVMPGESPYVGISRKLTIIALPACHDRRGWNLVDPCHDHPTFSQERMGIWLENVGNSTHLLDSNVRLVAIELLKQIQVVTTCKTASGDGK